MVAGCLLMGSLMVSAIRDPPQPHGRGQQQKRNTEFMQTRNTALGSRAYLGEGHLHEVRVHAAQDWLVRNNTDALARALQLYHHRLHALHQGVHALPCICQSCVVLG